MLAPSGWPRNPGTASCGRPAAAPRECCTVKPARWRPPAARAAAIGFLPGFRRCVAAQNVAGPAVGGTEHAGIPTDAPRGASPAAPGRVQAFERVGDCMTSGAIYTCSPEDSVDAGEPIAAADSCPAAGTGEPRPLHSASPGVGRTMTIPLVLQPWSSSSRTASPACPWWTAPTKW